MTDLDKGSIEEFLRLFIEFDRGVSGHEDRIVAIFDEISVDVTMDFMNRVDRTDSLRYLLARRMRLDRVPRHLFDHLLCTGGAGWNRWKCIEALSQNSTMTSEQWLRGIISYFDFTHETDDSVRVFRRFVEHPSRDWKMLVRVSEFYGTTGHDLFGRLVNYLLKYEPAILRDPHVEEALRGQLDLLVICKAFVEVPWSVETLEAHLELHSEKPHGVAEILRLPLPWNRVSKPFIAKIMARVPPSERNQIMTVLNQSKRPRR